MATVKKKSDRAGLVPDIPLPGNYPVLTLQLNLTRYQAAATGRWVLVLREPSDQIELYRAFEEVGDWAAVLEDLIPSLTEAVETMRFLQVGYAHQQP